MKFTKTPIALAAITLLSAAPLAAQRGHRQLQGAASGNATLSNVTWSQSSACEVVPAPTSAACSST